MKLIKPRWSLAAHLLPPIFSSLALVVFWPAHLFLFLIGIAIFSTILSVWIGIKNSSIPVGLQDAKLDALPQEDNKAKRTLKWLFVLFGLIFLLGVSSVFFVFLTAATQLPPEKLVFGEVTKIWQITFLVGSCLLAAQVIVAAVSSKKLPYLNNAFLKQKERSKLQRLLFGEHAETTEKLLISNQIFIRFSGFTTIAISLSVVILSIAEGLARWLGFEVPIGFQLQTMICSTLIYLPFITKRWRKRRGIKSKRSRAYRLFRLAVGLIIVIVLLSLLTRPLTGMVVSVQFLSYGLTVFQWELFILAWWVGITSLMSSQIVQLSEQKSLAKILVGLIVSISCTYVIFSGFLAYGGEEYFLAVIRQGILALILTALPIGGLILNVLPFQKIVESRTSVDQRKQFRDKEHLTHSLMQVTAITCALYWISGLSILFILLLIAAIPWLMRFLLVELMQYQFDFD